MWPRKVFRRKLMYTHAVVLWHAHHLPGEVSIVCIGTALPAIPGVPNMLALCCMAEAETICDEDMVEMSSMTLSLAAWSYWGGREGRREEGK